jgi:sec-independent protein translocase protein TatA
MHPLLFGNLGPSEILIVLALGLLLFGSKLPEVGRSLGRSLMEFKKGMKGFTDDVEATEREADRLIEDAERKRERERRREAGAEGAEEKPKENA